MPAYLPARAPEAQRAPVASQKDYKNIRGLLRQYKPHRAHLELGWHVAVASGDTEKDAIVFSQGGRGGDRVVGFGRSVN